MYVLKIVNNLYIIYIFTIVNFAANFISVFFN